MSDIANQNFWDGFAWFLNVSSAVVIVFVNKILMDRRWGFGFVYATTLCGFHFLSCAVTLWTARMFGLSNRGSIPFYENVIFSVIASASIASLNISLLFNTVGFYQISKLLTIPFICCVEHFWLDRSFSVPTLLSIFTVLFGVSIVTVVDFKTNSFGAIIALISVVTSGLQQILCGVLQRRNKLTSHEVLSNTAPVQGAILLTIGPFLDKIVSKEWVFNFEFTPNAVLFILISCGVAVAVNWSQFMCLGRFSAVTCQVLGHSKTILILLIGWLWLHETFEVKKILGMILAVSGMIAYGYFNSLPVESKVQRELPPQKSALVH